MGLSVVQTPYAETEFFRAILEDRAGDALFWVEDMTPEQRHELDVKLNRATFVVNRVRQLKDS